MLKIKKQKLIALALVLMFTGTFALLTTGILIGQGTAQAKTDSYEELRVFTQAFELIKKNYVEEPTDKDLVQGAIKGMLSNLDPHSSFMNERAFKEMNMDIRGEFQGVGIQIGIKNQQLTVISPIEDTPADRAGIAAGDKILKINDDWTKDMTIEEAVDRMRGPKGTSVRLMIHREGWDKPKEFKIVRDVIKVQSVKAHMLQNDIGYIKITQFQGQTGDEIDKKLKELSQKGMKKLVLDLRNNPGGILDASVDVSGMFLPKDSLVVYLQGRNVKDRRDYLSTETGQYQDVPMVVLVNAGSASASEIVAGALQDSKRAVILGTQTFGKGSVQTVFNLEGGTGMRLTTAKYYTPKGRSIQNVGIKPDIELKIAAPKEAKDGDSLHVVVREKDLEHHLTNETVKEDKKDLKEKKKGPSEEEEMMMEMVPKDEKEDTQLQKAIELLKTGEIYKYVPSAVKQG